MIINFKHFGETTLESQCATERSKFVMSNEWLQFSLSGDSLTSPLVQFFTVEGIIKNMIPHGLWNRDQFFIHLILLISGIDREVEDVLR